MTGSIDYNDSSEIPRTARRIAQDLIITSLLLSITAMSVFFLLFGRQVIHDDILMYLWTFREMTDYIPRESPVAFSFFFTLLYFVHYDVLGGNETPEFSFRLLALGLTVAMFLIIWAIESLMLDERSRVNPFFSRMVPLAAIFFIFNPIWITLHALAKQYVSILFILGYILAAHIWYQGIQQKKSRSPIKSTLIAAIGISVTLLCAFLAFLSSVLSVVLFVVMISFLIEKSARIEDFRRRLLGNGGLVLVTGYAAISAGDFIVQGQYSSRSPLDETTDMVISSLDVLQILPFPESYVFIPIIGVLFLEIARMIVAALCTLFRSRGFPTEEYGRWRNRLFLITTLFAMFWLSINREGPLNVAHTNLALTFLFLWVGWVAFQSSLRGGKDSNDSPLFGVCQLFTSLLLILLLFMILVFPEFNIYPTFPNDRITTFLIIPFSFLGAYNLRRREYDIYDILVTFVLPPIAITGVLFLAMPQQFSVLNLWLYLLDPELLVKLTCFLIILISWVLTEIAQIRSWVVRLKNTAFQVLPSFFSLEKAIPRGIPQALLLGIIILQTIGIGILMIMTPPMLTIEEEEFGKSEIGKIIPAGSRIGVSTMSLHHWIKYYQYRQYEIYWILENTPKDSFYFISWKFVSNPTPDTYDGWVASCPAGDFYLILTTSTKGKSYLIFDLEMILSYNGFSFVSEYKNMVFVLLFNNS